MTPPPTLARTHPRFSQADTSIRLILRRAPPLCCCITNTEAFPVTEERIQSDRSHFQAETQLPRREGGRGGPRDAKAGKMGAEAKFSLLCVSPYSTLLQAVDRTNISGVPAEAASVPVGGLNRLARREAPGGRRFHQNTHHFTIFCHRCHEAEQRRRRSRLRARWPPTVQASWPQIRRTAT